MNGIGNDYIFVNSDMNKIKNPTYLAVKLSNRNFGVGADGLILYEKSNSADYRMRIFNSDGSEAKMCGNAIRCLARLLTDSGLVRNDEIFIETLSGIRRVLVKEDEISVDMGLAKIVAEDTNSAIIDIGNPHNVFIKKDILEDSLLLKKQSEGYEGGINVEWVKVLSKNEIEVLVYERGSGITLACGTGASASAFYCFKKGLTDAKVKVNLAGGHLNIRIHSDDRVVMTGSADYSYFGEIDICDKKPQKQSIILNTLKGIAKEKMYGKIKRKLW
jgi:diaminopimelate epimerase